MYLSIDNVPQVLIDYVDKILAPKVQGQGSLLAFGVGASRYLLPTLVQAKLTEYLPSMKMLGMVTETNMLDLDKIAETAKSGLQVSGNLHIFNYMFDIEDINSLVQIAKGYANAE